MYSCINSAIISVACTLASAILHSDDANLLLRASRGQPILALERVVRDDLLDCGHVSVWRGARAGVHALCMTAVVAGGPWVKPAVWKSVQTKTAGMRTDGLRSTLRGRVR
jgi:hypothetical protein